ncbi:hypothetical protein OM076_21955 [Solirubrobacter ginsenosidimutans]|uniref:Uncharacterized protein n=1 Tax=Solirubrobacter ginsenosidimutans TaxID=490573 RepID=A0A9X3MXE7_9ACTN|nr:hypothetical protein [Solirubrobacter ginsenosidimutans]MDA0162952.1 hypothetical protein [Solirubrobacter ginsenosidimutans]
MPDLARALQLLSAMDARLVAVGHGRDERSVAAAREFAAAWPHEVAVVVDWPSTAASWLRPARKLTANHADAWVIADTPEGWANVERRLRETPNWDPMRTVLLR